MNRNKTTDTNQDNELFELCKEVYRRHQFWAGTDMIFGKEVGRDWRIMPLTLRIPKHNRIPLYTSDYLLEKLPEYVIEYDSYYEQDIRNYLCVMKVPDGYVALYDGLSLAHKVKVQRTDTPLKAL